MRMSVAPLFCKRHSGFKRPLKMIETGKYSTFKGPISNRDYHDAPSISRYLIANEFEFFLHTCVSMVTGEKEYKYPKTLNRKRHTRFAKIFPFITLKSISHGH